MKQGRISKIFKKGFRISNQEKVPTPCEGEWILHGEQTGHTISPILYGIFFEDLNGAGDGGLYPELVENRSFAYHPFASDWMDASKYRPSTAWETVGRGGRRCIMRFSASDPVSLRNPNYAVLTLEGPAGEGGVQNIGYRGGMHVQKGEGLLFSAHVRLARGEGSPLRVALENPEGRVLAEATLPGPTRAWGPREVRLVPSENSKGARLVLTLATEGEWHLDHVSLFPENTFRGRANGLRRDLAETIEALRPKFMRFPGGCIVHGRGLANAYRWKDTVGPIHERKPNWSRWGYHQTYGMGFFEYFQFCEDIGAKPIPVLPCGVSCGGETPYQSVPEEDLGPWIQDAIDLVEFANGATNTKWGKVRSDMGHPAPFGLEYLGLGNEEHDTRAMRQIYPLFVEAVRAQCPEIKIVGTSGTGDDLKLLDLMKAVGVDVTDEHYYKTPEWFIEHRDRFDTYPAGEPFTWVGEYASHANRLYNAVAEAVYLTGIERNSDRVIMHSYAPLLAHYEFTQWKNANMIWFDDERLVTTPNYHVQKVFGEHLGDRWVPSEIRMANPNEPGAALGVSSTVSNREKMLYLKVANPMPHAVHLTLSVEGLKLASAPLRWTEISGGATAANDREHPSRICPHVKSVALPADRKIVIPSMSVVVIRAEIM